MHVSGSLNINEIECVRLFYLASEKVMHHHVLAFSPLLMEQAKRDPTSQQNVKSAVLNLVWDLHFSRRQNLLVAILDIIHVRARGAGLP